MTKRLSMSVLTMLLMASCGTVSNSKNSYASSGGVGAVKVPIDQNKEYRFYNSPCDLSAFSDKFPYRYDIKRQNGGVTETGCYRYDPSTQVATTAGSYSKEIQLSGDAGIVSNTPQSPTVIADIQQDGVRVRLLNTPCEYSLYSLKYPYKYVATKVGEGTIESCYSLDKNSQVANLKGQGQDEFQILLKSSNQRPENNDCGFFCVVGGIVKVISDAANAGATTAQSYQQPVVNLTPSVVQGSDRPVDLGGRFDNKPNATCMTTINGMQVAVPCRY